VEFTNISPEQNASQERALHQIRHYGCEGSNVQRFRVEYGGEGGGESAHVFGEVDTEGEGCRGEGDGSKGHGHGD